MAGAAWFLALRHRHIAGCGLHSGYADVDAYLNDGRRYADTHGLPNRDVHADRNSYAYRHRDAHTHRDPYAYRYRDAGTRAHGARNPYTYRHRHLNS